MNLSDLVLGALDRARSAEKVSAHCDIPCGIYDPHAAQIGALTIIRMNQLIEGLALPSSDKAAMDAYLNTMSRYIAVKEEHARAVENELLIFWTDYFRPEHLEKFPDMHDTFWKTMKLCSAVKQQINMQAAQDLLAGVNKIAGAFWASKNIATASKPSNQPAGGEIVVPA
ncbi:MAG: superoxide dismutase, Ni [Chloroflexota bacterium]